MRKFRLMLATCFVFTCLFSLALSSTAMCAKPIVLTWASMVPQNTPEAMTLQKYFFDKVNERAKGQLVIKFRGGPETIPAISLGDAVKRGVVDIGELIVGYYEAIVPGVNALMLTELTPQEERAGGAYDFIVKLHKQHGLMYLGHATPSRERFFYTYLNKRVEKPEDFTHLRIGSGPAARAATLAWGAKVIPLKSVTDYYTSMQRGLYDGLSSCPLVTWVALGCQEVTKYIIDDPYYKSTMAVIMNLNSWNKLPKHLQNIMNQAMIEYPRYAMPAYTQRLKAARKKAEEAGDEFYKLKPKVRDWFIGTAYKAAWQYQQEKFPEVTPKLKALLTK